METNRFVYSKILAAQHSVPEESRDNAPDKWDSARFSRLFWLQVFSRFASRIHAHPLAGNAHRWAANRAFMYK